jgi:hypothetical protein
MLLRRLVLRSLMQQQQNCHNHMVSVFRGHPAAGVKVTDRGGAMTDISLQETATTAKRVRGRPFAKGQSGNPAGRPRGSINRSTRAAQQLLDGEATALSRKAIELALAGDPTALRLCLDRTVAPRRDRSVELSLPPINSAADILGAIKAVADAVGRGGITPGEGFALSQMIESFLRAIDASDFDNRLRQLEDAQSARRPDPYGYTPR